MGAAAVAWHPESARRYGPGRVQEGPCGLLGWMEPGSRALWARAMAGWVPGKLGESPGTSGLGVRGRGRDGR